MGRGRADVIGRACQTIEWLGDRRSAFTKHDYAAEFYVCHRTALRWLQAAVATNWVSIEREGGCEPTLYRSEILVKRRVE